jgi:hypothetical protein
VLDKLARSVAPASVKRHLATHEAERERHEQARHDARAARLEAQPAKLEAGEPVCCACVSNRRGKRRCRREARGTRPRRRLRNQWGSVNDDTDDAE